MISIRLYKTMRICVVLILSTCGLAANAQDGPSDGFSDGMIAIDGQTPWLVYDQTRFGLGHTTGNGIGYDRDFTTLEAFVPFVYSDGNGIIFGDGRALLESDPGPRGLNLGIGHRFYSPELDGLIGTYLYYDYRETDRSSFQQLSPGFEILTDRWDLRLNAYIPAIFEDRQPIENRFLGNFLLIDRAEAAYTGFDAEFGLAIPALEQFHTRLYGGGYYFNASKGQDALGWKTRAETRLPGILTLDLSLQHDDLFDTTLNSTLTLRLPRNGLAGLFQRDQNSNEHAGLFSRLTDRVHRQQNIVVDEDDGVLAFNPTTAKPLYFLHVASGGNGNGSFDSPYDTLAGALTDTRYTDRANAQAADVIYVRNSVESPITHTGDIVLQPDTQLLSNGPLQLVDTTRGTQQLPFSGAAAKQQFFPMPTEPTENALQTFDIVELRHDTREDCDLTPDVKKFVFATVGTILLANSPVVTRRSPSITGNIALDNGVTISGFDITGRVTGDGVNVKCWV